MELISQRAKAIMEGCKDRAREVGLCFGSQTLEYIVTNRDLIELGPKHMIPTLYDYWVHDVEVLKEKGIYEFFPSNPYETVINTRPAISFYNDNNPDWLNVMIFYHVLAHIDFFQHNRMFQKTWDRDFAAEALSDKRAIGSYRSKHGRFVDYAIEWSRNIDNLAGFHHDLNRGQEQGGKISRLDYFFDVFLQSGANPQPEYMKELERYNQRWRDGGDQDDAVFWAETESKYPEFRALWEKANEEKKRKPADLMDWLMENSPVLKKRENRWIAAVMEIVRRTSLYFQPQIRTKIMNEGWASYWHDRLFREDERVRGHEVDYAVINSRVTSLPMIGLNPYAIGMRLFEHVEDMTNKGRLDWAYQKIASSIVRRDWDKQTGSGQTAIFRVREEIDDFQFLKNFIDQEFMDRHKLFVAGKRLNDEKAVWEYFIQSRQAEAYRQMILDTLYHPPWIMVNEVKTNEQSLYLDHAWEGLPLVKDYIQGTMFGIQKLWGGTVNLDTWENSAARYETAWGPAQGEEKLIRVVYVLDGTGKFTKKAI